MVLVPTQSNLKVLQQQIVRNVTQLYAKMTSYVDEQLRAARQSHGVEEVIRFIPM